ncbi:MAG: tryptophan 7-halogenase [Hellea sp.]
MNSIIVIGGGPAGATAARRLSQTGFDVSLIHRGQSEGFKAGETLPPIANPLLRRLGIDACLHQGPHISCPGNQSIFGSADIVDFDFIFTSNGMGWHLDRTIFEQQLLNLANEAGTKILNDTSVSSMTMEKDKWKIAVSLHGLTPHIISADYIIDASGHSRIFAKSLGIQTKRFDKLAARAAIFPTQVTPQDRRTLIEAAPNGWWYSACIPTNMRVVMYFSDSDLKEFRAIKSIDSFMEGLKETSLIFKRLKNEAADAIDITAIDIHTFACSSAHATQVQGDRWISIGDAAMSFDPLSSQGLWTALDGADRAAAAILAQKTNAKNSLGAYSDWVRQTYGQYLKEKENYYAMETRWQRNTFWNRRNAAS